MPRITNGELDMLSRRVNRLLDIHNDHDLKEIGLFIERLQSDLGRCPHCNELSSKHGNENLGCKNGHVYPVRASVKE